MRVFMLSLDKTLLADDVFSGAPRRHEAYGRFLEALDVLVYTNRREGFKGRALSANVTVHPSASLGKAFFAFDALRVFRDTHQRQPVDLVVAQDPFLLGLISWWLKRRYKIKLQISFHGDFWHNPWWLAQRWFHRLFLWVSYFTVPRADAVRVVSQAILDKLVRRGINREKIAVIPTPVDAGRFRDVSRARVAEIEARFQGRRIILFVGGLARVKNIPFLLAAFARVKKECPAAHLLLIGDGPEREPIRSEIRRLGLDGSVETLGRMGQEDIAAYYHAAVCLALTSFSEGLPKVLVEAGYAGLPAVATKVGGIPEVIRDGENGFLVAVGDTEMLARKIITLLRDETLKERMGRISRQLVAERFGDTTEKLIAFWREIVAKKKIDH